LASIEGVFELKLQRRAGCESKTFSLRYLSNLP
jgi:hypothetical protein